LVVVVEALGDEQVLACVNNFVDFAFDVPEFVLLSSQLVWLAQTFDITLQMVDLIAVSSVLHLKVIVLFYKLSDLVLKSVLIHCSELVLKSTVSVQIDGSESFVLAGGAMTALSEWRCIGACWAAI